MFKKPVKVKSNTQSKGTERKHFKELLLKSFSNLTESDFNELLPKKEALNVLKVVTHNETTIIVYSVQKRPMVFEYEKRFYPTVFLLWKFPNIIYAFTTHQQVMGFITSGADLMLPGVVTPPSYTNIPKYGTVQQFDTVYVNLTSNKAAVAVGVASQGSNAMTTENSRGKCVNIYHYYGDHLCTLEGMPNLPLANLGPPEWLTIKSYEEDFPALGGSPKKENIQIETDLYVESTNNEDVVETNDETNTKDNTEDTVKDSVEEMDELVLYCFLGAVKYSKSLSLPVLTSNFFKLNMLPICPEDKTLDIKKTSYKKLKPFLKKMCEEGIVTVKEIKSGVEAITAINRDHPKLQAFYLSPQARLQKDNGEDENKQSTNVTESYVITEAVVQLFEGHSKGETLEMPEIRKCITKYIKENNLLDEANEKYVKPKNKLAKICKTEHPIAWEEVIEKVCAAMKNCYKVKSGHEEIMGKGKVSPIALSVSVRSGNKKVTLVDNLELFGIRINEFAKECQHGVAASTSISRPPGKKCDQLLVQGNQVLFIYNLLIEKYKVPKKYIKGLENAPKKKK